MAARAQCCMGDRGMRVCVCVRRKVVGMGWCVFCVCMRVCTEESCRDGMVCVEGEEGRGACVAVLWLCPNASVSLPIRSDQTSPTPNSLLPLAHPRCLPPPPPFPPCAVCVRRRCNQDDGRKPGHRGGAQPATRREEPGRDGPPSTGWLSTCPHVLAQDLTPPISLLTLAHNAPFCLAQ